MSEETEKKTEVEEPVKTENGLISDKGLDILDQNTGFSSKSPILKEIKYVIETKEQTKKRVDNEITAGNKKIWLTTFERTMSSFVEINKKTGTAKSTFYYWFKNDEQFKNAIFKVMEYNVDDMEDILVAKAKSGNMTALRIWLENNHPKYSKKIKVETTYTGDKTLEDLIAEDEKAIDDFNNKIDELNQEKEKGQSVVHSEHHEDKKQEGEDSPISA